MRSNLQVLVEPANKKVPYTGRAIKTASSCLAEAQSQREAQQLQGQLEGELQRRQQRARRNRQRLEEA